MDCVVAVMYYTINLFVGRALDGILRSNVIRDMRANIAEVHSV